MKYMGTLFPLRLWPVFKQRSLASATETIPGDRTEIVIAESRLRSGICLHFWGFGFT